ncbi:hypothetical protein NQ315_011082 [Exocentrus adspersus]|uniref:Uncharacterized protein n=1 Tax=Exocentrus adspersus TaxID=1586481 RepID=A0AAV8VX23_9CUCU|nr:hypothetical protein NQ315_011082 [Exocentrus adspersus]
MQSEGEDLEDKPKLFKVSFVDKILPGRSNIRIDRPLTIPSILTPKFYTNCLDLDEDKQHEELVKKYLDKLKVHESREKYKDPVTENQRYGWYQVRLTDADWKDRRLYFHKRTDVIVPEHLMNYAKIREYN